MKQNICILLFIIISGNLCGQALSTPDGIVYDNTTTDQILVNGNTKLVNPNGRTLLIERDDDDSWLTFHDPNNYWFSMGIDQSNNGLFTLSSGGYLGVASHFLMNSSGDIAIGKSQPSHKLDLNGNFQVYPGADAGTNGALKLRFIPSSSASIIQANSDYVWADHDIIINAANSTSGNSDQLVVHRTGNIGVGVSTPLNPLDVNGVGRFRRNGSTTSGLTIGGDALSLRGWGANNPYIEWISSNNARQGYFGWNTNRLSLVMENGYNFTVENGNVGIGTSNPGEKLTVNGTIYSKEVRVDLSVPGPDYVFEDSYQLLSIAQLSQYVRDHKHLPEVPSAKEMEEQGILVGQMNMILLKKVEELTLYLIELKRENQMLREQFERRLGELASEIEKLQ